MKLPDDAIITSRKFTHYLLVERRKDDKSKWLSQAGYTLNNWQQLELDLRRYFLSQNATHVETNKFGRVYQIIGMLKGPNGISISAVTVWMIEHESGIAKFITMYPNKE